MCVIYVQIQLTDVTRNVENFRNKKYMIAHGTLDGKLKAPFHEPTNHADERHKTAYDQKKIDRRDRFNWSADQGCLVFPLTCDY